LLEDKANNPALNRRQETGTKMFFILKSIFWLALVMSWMPGGADRLAGELGGGAATIGANLRASVETQCLKSPAERAILVSAAAGAAVTALQKTSPVPQKPKAAAAGKPAQSSLKAADLKPAWKG
jgi:hypothetical protein